jgi:N-acetyl-gamma-glutamyl-phosphate reductase
VVALRSPHRSLVHAGIAGASGYAGLELQRLLRRHPRLRASVLQARTHPYQPIDTDTLAGCDVVFLCLPHGASRPLGEALAETDARVIDLGSDFRLDEWCYGLPEARRDEIRGSRLIANPGCYATAALLGLLPLVEAGLAAAPIVIDGKSGVSGAGHEPSPRTHLPDLHGGVTPYAPTGHHQIAEIEQGLGLLVTFTPHLLPTSRGLLVTSYVPLAPDAAGLLDLYRRRYRDERFVQLCSAPAPQRLAGTNTVAIGVHVDQRTGTAIVLSALDNLVKGAAGQAIQNANLMLGFDEATGLDAEPLWP